MRHTNTDKHSSKDALYSATTFPQTHGSTIKIDKACYEQLLAMHKLLIRSIDFEECLAILIENYIEFETTSINNAVRHSLTNPSIFQEHLTNRITFNRTFTNVLSSGSTLIDQIKRYYYTAHGKTPQTKEFVNKSLSDEYAHRFGYRIMCAMRNLSQHEMPPVYGIASHSERDMDSPNQTLHNYTSINIPVSVIARSKFKKEILKELYTLGITHIDINHHCKDYITGLSHVHNIIRDATASIFSKASVEFHTFIHKLSDTLDEANKIKVIGITAIKKDQEGETLEEITTTKYIIDDIVHLRRKYAFTGDLTNSIASNKTKTSTQVNRDNIQR